jgi:hypothetical protein
MRALILLGLLVSPAVIGSVAVARMEGPEGFVIALIASLIMLREALLICMILMRRWQYFGRELFLIEERGRHRWVDAFELKSMHQPCRVRAQEFRPYFMRPPRRE